VRSNQFRTAAPPGRCILGQKSQRVPPQSSTTYQVELSCKNKVCCNVLNYVLRSAKRAASRSTLSFCALEVDLMSLEVTDFWRTEHRTYASMNVAAREPCTKCLAKSCHASVAGPACLVPNTGVVHNHSLQLETITTGTW
jgi:hypothetical protein